MPAEGIHCSWIVDRFFMTLLFIVIDDSNHILINLLSHEILGNTDSRYRLRSK